MNIVSGNIWDKWYDSYMRVIPTNLGWRSDGCNVMGRGVARQAAEQYSGLAEWYGSECQRMRRYGRDSLVCFRAQLIMLPVKPLDKIQPHLSWKGKADPDLVLRSIQRLAAGYDSYNVVLPLVGCGNGGLDPAVVAPMLTQYLAADNFTLVLTPSSFKDLVIERGVLS